MFSPDQQAELQAAVRHHLAGALDRAAVIYERLAAHSPRDYQVNHLLGTLRQQQGRPREALARLTKACASRPLSAPTTMCLGVVLGALGRHADAEKTLRRAAALDPRSAETRANLGAQYLAMGRLPEAVAGFRQSIELKPDYASGWTGLGSALHCSGRGAEAIICHTRALEIDPGQARARFARAQAWQACHGVDEALADFDAHLERQPGHLEARSFRLFMLNYRSEVTREELLAEHLAYGRAVEAELPAAPAPAPAPPPRDAAGGRRPGPAPRLKLGFLSPDFRTHSVAFFIEPLLSHLDRSQFEVTLYHDHFCVDAVSERLRQGADRWRHLAGMAPAVAEEVIRGDAPDILVDLAGHTGFNRLPIFARRLAPVQATYLGYPNTTGLRAMDYRLTDEVADPAGEADSLHTEELVRFSPVAWAYSPPAEAPVLPEWDPSTGSARSARPGRPIVFGSFNALSKLSAATLALWRDLLAAVPDSRLLLKSASEASAGWSRRLTDAGLTPDRVTLLAPAADLAGHLAAYAQVDVALDPTPYNGTTTTCEALWMGVPVVALAGDRHAARVGASLLTAIGHPEWIARTAAEYIRIAAAVAADHSGENRGASLREQMRRSPLLDHRAQAARFGAALRACFEKKRVASGVNFSASPPVVEPEPAAV